VAVSNNKKIIIG